jgi:hypothetical protein
MHIYLNVHGMLEQLRQKADLEKTRGPRVRKKRNFDHFEDTIFDRLW